MQKDAEQSKARKKIRACLSMKGQLTIKYLLFKESLENSLYWQTFPCVVP